MAFDNDLQALTALVEAVRENTTEARLVKIAQLETRDALRELLAALPAAVAPATNGHAAQLALGSATNGHAPAALPAAPPAPDVDKLGNPRVEGVRYEDRSTPVYIARITKGGRRLYASVAVDAYGGAGDAYRYAVLALRCFKGEDVARNMALLPKRLRHKVEDQLSPE